MGHLLVHLLVVLSPYVKLYAEQFEVHTLFTESELNLPFGHVLTQNFVTKSA